MSNLNLGLSKYGYFIKEANEILDNDDLSIYPISGAKTLPEAIKLFKDEILVNIDLEIDDSVILVELKPVTTLNFDLVENKIK